MKEPRTKTFHGLCVRAGCGKPIYSRFSLIVDPHLGKFHAYCYRHRTEPTRPDIARLPLMQALGKLFFNGTAPRITQVRRVA
jgi:hypothetical protein